MAGEEDEIDDTDEEGGDDLCDEETILDDHELTNDEDLPAATGGVAE